MASGTNSLRRGAQESGRSVEVPPAGVRMIRATSLPLAEVMDKGLYWGCAPAPVAVWGSGARKVELVQGLQCWESHIVCVLTIALSVVSSLRMQATSATLGSLPAAIKRA